MNTEPSNDDSIDAISRAVLYEGHLLYPYRLSSIKNRQRWTFGVLYPRRYCEHHNGAESSTMRTECLLEGSGATTVAGRVRFLQHGREGTVEREVEISPTTLNALCADPLEIRFAFEPLKGIARLAAEQVEDGIFKITLDVANTSPSAGANREDALRSALISAQSLLRLAGGKFFSAIEPPAFLQGQSICENIGVWPVLVGDESARNAMLSAPIVLYDFPKIAPESPGDFFDGTEIDEMLSLRILTLTDSEKVEMAQVEQRARSLLHRTESLAPGDLLSLHGALRDGPGANGSPEGEPPDGDGDAPAPFRKGDRVRLRPQGRADIFDLALAGMTATVISIERDFENRHHACVVLDDDPGRDLGLEGKPGHRFFFKMNEIEPL